MRNHDESARTIDIPAEFRDVAERHRHAQSQHDPRHEQRQHDQQVDHGLEGEGEAFETQAAMTPEPVEMTAGPAGLLTSPDCTNRPQLPSET